MAKIIKSIATLGYIGYLPAPGTMGTIVGLFGAYLLSSLSFPYNYLIIILFHAFGLFIIDKALPFFFESDPQQIIIDEFIGTLVTFIGIAYNPVIFCIGFILFRLFDIFKPLGIHYIEKLPGAYGILLDDTVAGLFANFILRFLFV